MIELNSFYTILAQGDIKINPYLLGSNVCWARLYSVISAVLNSGVENRMVKEMKRDFPGGAVVKNPSASAGDMGLSPGPGRSHMPRSN